VKGKRKERGGKRDVPKATGRKAAAGEFGKKRKGKSRESVQAVIRPEESTNKKCH